MGETSLETVSKPPCRLAIIYDRIHIILTLHSIISLYDWISIKLYIVVKVSKGKDTIFLDFGRMDRCEACAD